MEVAENLEKLDQPLFEGFVTRDPLGFFLVGPPDALEQSAAPKNFLSARRVEYGGQAALVVAELPTSGRPSFAFA